MRDILALGEVRELKDAMKRWGPLAESQGVFRLLHRLDVVQRDTSTGAVTLGEEGECTCAARVSAVADVGRFRASHANDLCVACASMVRADIVAQLSSEKQPEPSPPAATAVAQVGPVTDYKRGYELIKTHIAAMDLFKHYNDILDALRTLNVWGGGGLRSTRTKYV